MIIGTAGHIDHGKTELVKALTGVDTDRLAEEKKRGISIDLGFASFFLPSGLEAGIVDVPGHERFIKNMLAGSTGIDLMLLVVAAADGVMAQTIEHLAIAELLGVGAAVVAVTKADLAGAERLDEVEEQVRELLESGSFKDAPIVRVSAKRRLGLEELVAAIETQAGLRTERLLDLPPRLPIDRSFILAGAGRVVTGTLWSGVLAATGLLELLPTGETCRPRRIEVHGNPVTKGLAGQRVAVNIVVSGPPPRRGDWLVPPATFSLTSELLARVTVVPQAPRALKRRARLRLYHGTREVAAVLSPIGEAQIEPGRQGYARLVLAEPIVAVFRDRFILRSLSPMATVAGGIILENRTKGRGGQVDIDHLAALAGDDRSAVREFFQGRRLPLTGDEVADAVQLGSRATEKAVAELVGENAITPFNVRQRVYYLATEAIAGCARDLDALLAGFHAEQPYRFGIEKEAAQRRLWPELSPSQADILFDYFISMGSIVRRDGRLAAADRVLDAMAVKLEQIGQELQGFSPPDLRKLGEDTGIAAADLKALLGQLRSDGSVVAAGGDQYFTRGAVDEATGRLLEFLAEAGEITVSQFKDLLGTTRKYAVLLLEYFDRQKVTRRVGDVRVVYDARVEEL
ncbi:MAG: selenocysteine-specific translation elongation factor [Actinomycetota bacterium]|nr:selenocysteine-specific translation elongation factor [Actinomycetota bacterium]